MEGLWEIYLFIYLLIYLFYLFTYFLLFRAAPAAYGGSQATGAIGAVLLTYATATAMPDPSRIWDLHHSMLEP